MYLNSLMQHVFNSGSLSLALQMGATSSLPNQLLNLACLLNMICV